MTPGCRECVHRRDVSGSAHSACHHPATDAVHREPLMQLAGLAGKRGGPELVAMTRAFAPGSVATPDGAAAALHIEAVARGVEMGWFVWPVNFDPVWLTRCDGFTPIAAAPEARA